MLKHLTQVVVVAVLFGFSTAHAQQPAQLAGKVVAVEEGKIKVAVDGELPAWAKAGAAVKLAEGPGKVLEVSPPPVVVTIKTKAASKLKTGDAVKATKGSSMQGC